MCAHLLPFEKKTRYKKVHFSHIFKRSSSIHKNNPALIASIVLKKIYFHGICALFKKYIYSKSKILRVKNVKKQNLTHPKAAKLATL